MILEQKVFALCLLIGCELWSILVVPAEEHLALFIWCRRVEFLPLSQVDNSIVDASFLWVERMRSWHVSGVGYHIRVVVVLSSWNSCLITAVTSFGCGARLKCSGATGFTYFAWFVHTGTIICWWGGSTILWVTLNSHMSQLCLPFALRSWKGTSGKWIRWYRISSNTEFCLKYEIPFRMFANVGRIINVSSNCLSSMENCSKTCKTCLGVGTMLPLAIATLNSGAGISSSRAMEWVVRMLRKSVFDIALCKAVVYSSAFFSYCANWSGIYIVLWRRFNWIVAVNNRISVVLIVLPFEKWASVFAVVEAPWASKSLCVAAGGPQSERVVWKSQLPSSSLASSVFASFGDISVCVGLWAKC